MCGEDAWEEVEVSVFVFDHVVVEFGFYCVGAVLFEAATSLCYVERVWLRSSGKGPCMVWWVDMQVERFVGGGGGSVGG